jgi:hypothetical protein
MGWGAQYDFDQQQPKSALNVLELPQRATQQRVHSGLRICIT